MAFSTKNAQDGKFGPSQYIQMGPVEAKITKIEVSQNKAGDKYIPVLYFETKPLGGDFKGVDGASGQVGNINFGSWSTGDDGKFEETVNNFAHIAKIVGVREEADKIEAVSITDFCNKINSLIKGKYTWWLFGGEEYQGTDKDGNPKIKIKIKLPRYSFVAATKDDLLNIQKDKVWPTKDNPYYFKQLAKMDSDSNPAFKEMPKNEQLNLGTQGMVNKPIDDSGLPF